MKAAICQSCGAAWPPEIALSHYCWAKIGTERCKGDLIFGNAKKITHRPEDYPEATFSSAHPLTPSDCGRIRAALRSEINLTHNRLNSYKSDREPDEEYITQLKRREHLYRATLAKVKGKR